MAGNVWEWCLDEHGNPRSVSLTTTVARVVRGGSWRNVAGGAHSATRYGLEADFRGDYLGLRVLCSSPIE
jgi:formylglycine-generating enzyme required for sulfatase activity